MLEAYSPTGMRPSSIGKSALGASRALFEIDSTGAYADMTHEGYVPSACSSVAIIERCSPATQQTRPFRADAARKAVPRPHSTSTTAICAPAKDAFRPRPCRVLSRHRKLYLYRLDGSKSLTLQHTSTGIWSVSRLATRKPRHYLPDFPIPRWCTRQNIFTSLCLASQNK